MSKPRASTSSGEERCSRPLVEQGLKTHSGDSGISQPCEEQISCTGSARGRRPHTAAARSRTATAPGAWTSPLLSITPGGHPCNFERGGAHRTVPECPKHPLALPNPADSNPTDQSAGRVRRRYAVPRPHRCFFAPSGRPTPGSRTTARESGTTCPSALIVWGTDLALNQRLGDLYCKSSVTDGSDSSLTRSMFPPRSVRFSTNFGYPRSMWKTS